MVVLAEEDRIMEWMRKRTVQIACLGLKDDALSTLTLSEQEFDSRIWDNEFAALASKAGLSYDQVASSTCLLFRFQE